MDLANFQFLQPKILLLVPSYVFTSLLSQSPQHSVTDIPGSNPEQAPCRPILLVVHDLIRKAVRGVKAVMTLRNLSLGKAFINCLVGRSFATECFYMKH
jgi:hypothetical protein